MNDEIHVPTVSIGLAVRNGMPYLIEALDSILAQTYTDFELIISDNASTDETEDVCKSYAARDSRIRYYRNATNIGGANNENLTFRLSRGKYFRWAAHDDILAPTLLERCVEVLDREPGIVLCHTYSISIDANGNELGRVSRNACTSPDRVQRFKQVALGSDWLEESYGLVRSAVLSGTNLQQNYTNSDRTLVSEIAIHGSFRCIAAYLFFKRIHSRNAYIDWRTRMAWFIPAYSRSGTITMPYWSQLLDYCILVHRSNLTRKEAIRAYAFLISKWIPIHAARLSGDVKNAVVGLARGKAWRQRRYAATTNW